MNNRRIINIIQLNDIFYQLKNILFHDNNKEPSLDYASLMDATDILYLILLLTLTKTFANVPKPGLRQNPTCDMSDNQTSFAF
jgi:hypothetical protein